MLKISELRRRQKKSRMLRIALVEELADVEEDQGENNNEDLE